MTREWQPGESVPERFSGMPVTFAWNEVALSSMLRILAEYYPSGHKAMVDAVREAMRNYTPPKPEEPTKWLAAAEDAHGDRWVRDGLCRDGASEGDWWSVDRAANGSPEPWRADWSVIDVVRILSHGYDPEAGS